MKTIKNILKTQKPCIRQGKLLCFVDILAILSFSSMMLVWSSMGIDWGIYINFYDEGGILGIFFISIFVLGTILQLRLLKKHRYILHGLLSILVGVLVFLFWSAVSLEIEYSSYNYYGWYLQGLTMRLSIFPYLASLLFSAIISMKKEIYVEN